MNKSSFSHDHFFRSVFYKPERTAALLRLAAKTSTPLSEFINTVDLSTLQEISESFVTEEDKGTADLAFTVQLKDQKKNAKLLVGIIEEHKSYKDNKIFKQLIRYWHGIMVLKQENIPTVVLIIYNGELEWNPKKEPMFPDYPPYYHQIGLPFICEFIDVGKAFDEEKTEDLDGATIFALLLMKHAFSPEILKKKYYKARDALLSIPKEERTDLIKKTILYLPNKSKSAWFTTCACSMRHLRLLFSPKYLPYKFNTNLFAESPMQWVFNW